MCLFCLLLHNVEYSVCIKTFSSVAELVKVKLVSFHLELLSMKEMWTRTGFVLLFKDERGVLLKAVTWLLITVPECMSLHVCVCVYLWWEGQNGQS